MRRFIPRFMLARRGGDGKRVLLFIWNKKSYRLLG